MIKSGSKGNVINMSQIMTSVSHQHTNYKYCDILEGDLKSMGFIGSSYVEGLDSDEFMLHLVASRTGVINMGVQTSSTGYLNRRASMIMADCMVDYMGSIIDNRRITCFLNRLCNLPICHCLSSSTFWCYSNHPLG